MQQRSKRGSNQNTGSRYVGRDRNYTELTSHTALSSDKSYGRSVYGGKQFDERGNKPKKKTVNKHPVKKYGQQKNSGKNGKTLGKFEGGKRVYFFDVQETGTGDKALSITQTRNDNGRQRRDTVMVFEDHLEEFMNALSRAVKKL